MKITILTALLFLSYVEKSYGLDPDCPDRILRPKLMLFLSNSLFLLYACVCRFIKTYFNLPVPHSVFLLTSGLIIGFSMSKSKDILDDLYYQIDPNTLMILYLVILTYRVSFCVDICAFIKSFSQILILAGPVSILTAVSVGLVMRLIVNTAWSYDRAILLGTLSMPVLAKEITNQLLNFGSGTRHTIVLLEGETIIGLATFIIAFHVSVLAVDKVFNEWYQFISVFLRLVTFGPLIGFVFGYFGCLLMRVMSPNKIRVLFVTVSIPFIVYYFSTEIVYIGDGGLPVIVVGIMMGQERASLSPDLNEFLVLFWQMAFQIFGSIVHIRIGIYVATHVFLFNIEDNDIVYGFVAYLIINAARFVGYLIFMPILKRIGWGLSFRSTVICIWGGLKNPVGIFYAVTYLERFDYEKEVIVRDILPFIFMTIYLTLLVNGTMNFYILKLLGFYEVSVTNRININNCMKYIFERRDCTITILKMDRFLANANWPIVIKCTSLKHPYDLKMEDVDEDDYYTGYRFTTCPDCKKEILNEPTAEEFEEMRKVAKMKVLKAKKRCYSHQFEQGLISTAGVKILTQAIDLALDNNIELVELKVLIRVFEKKGIFFGEYTKSDLTAYFRNYSQVLIPKRQKFGRKCKHSCYETINSTTFDICIYVIILFNLIETIVEIAYLEDEVSINMAILSEINTICIVAYIVEAILKTWSYSVKYLFINCIKSYFSSKWNVFEFMLILFGIIDILVSHRQTYKPNEAMSEIYLYDLYGRFLRGLRFMKMCTYTRKFFPRLAAYIDKKVDNHVAFGYELGKSFIDATEDVLEMLPYMIEHDIIRQNIKKKLQQDRLIVTKLLALIQKDKPWIAVTVKTTQAIRSVLHSIRDKINELKVSGWIDNSEYSKLMEAFEEKYRYVAFNLKFVRPNSAEVIFKEVTWMGTEDAIINFLFENAEMKKFVPGDVVCAEFHVAPGIFIIVSGLFMMNYTPRNEVLEQLDMYGCLPIVEYIPSFRFREPCVDYIVSGNSIGELCFLTGRPYNCTITAEANSQAYLLKKIIIQRAIAMSRDPIKGLQSRMWRAVAIRLALPFLTQHPSFQNVPQEETKYDLELALVPNTNKQKVFDITDQMKHVVVVEGVVKDSVTGEKFVAPAYIPRTTKKLLLSKSSQIQIPKNINSKLLIIPERDAAKGDFIRMEDDDSHRVGSISSSQGLEELIERRNIDLKQRMSHNSRELESLDIVMGTAQSSITESYKIYVSDDSESSKKKKRKMNANIPDV